MNILLALQMGCALRGLGNDVTSSVLLILSYLLDILRIMCCTITNGLHISTGLVYTFNCEMSIVFLSFPGLSLFLRPSWDSISPVYRSNVCRGRAKGAGRLTRADAG